MADITGSRIGGRIEDMLVVQAGLDATGQQAGAQATAAAARVERLQREVAEVTARLKADFGELASELREAAARATANLHGADWDGRSRGAADAANLAFANEIDRVLRAAHEGADGLHDALTAQVMSFFDDMSGSFAQVLRSIEENYHSLAGATRAYAARLADDDAVAIRFG